MRTRGELLTVADLDRAVATIVDLRGDIAGSYWHLGRALLDIRDRRLHLLRPREDGSSVPRYRSWEQCVHHECRVSAASAYAAMQVAEELTEEQARALGRRASTLVLRAAPEDRAAIIASAEAGATTRQIADEAQRSREARGYRRPGRHASAGARGRAAQLAESARADTSTPTPPAPERITVATIHGRHRVPLHVRPSSPVGVSLASLPRATSVDEGTIGRLELTNDVAMLISVGRDRDGHLVAIVDVQRDDDDGDDGETAPSEQRTG